MILTVKRDGSYRWQCDDCGAERSPTQVAFERMGATRRNRAYRERHREGGWGAW